MERSDERPRAHPEPEQVPGQTDPLDTSAERRPGDLPENADQVERDRETGAETARADDAGGRYDTTGERRDYDQTGERRDYDQTPEGRSYSGQAPPTGGENDPAYAATAEGQDYGRQSSEGQNPGGDGTRPEGQAAGSYEEAAERKAVQPAGAGTSTLDPSASPEQSSPTSSTPETAGTAGTEEQPGVLPRQDAQGFQARWEAVQAVFVDDPQAATEQADALVGEVMDQLLRLRQEYLTQLRGAVGDGADTEAMRIALRRYRAFFNVLLGT
jgi:hypothetical protein